MWAHFTTSQILIPFFHALKWKSIYALHKAECIFTNFCFYHVTSKIAENEFIYGYIWRWWCVHKGITSANSEAHKDRKQPNEMSLNNTKRMSRLSAPTLNAIVKFHFFSGLASLLFSCVLCCMPDAGLSSACRPSLWLVCVVPSPNNPSNISCYILRQTLAIWEYMVVYMAQRLLCKQEIQKNEWECARAYDNCEIATAWASLQYTPYI